MVQALSRNHIEAADRFHSAAIHALRHVRREDPATGLSAARLSALSVLVYGGPRTLGELAAAEQVRPATMTRIAQSLVEDGYALREADPADGRVVRLSPTAKGRRVMQKGRERRVTNLARLFGRLTPEEVGHVREAAELVEKALSGNGRRPSPAERP